MSSDLLEAFRASPEPAQHRPAATVDTVQAQEEDDFGEFEVPETDLGQASLAKKSAGLLDLSVGNKDGPPKLSSLVDSKGTSQFAFDIGKTLKGNASASLKDEQATTSQTGSSAQLTDDDWGDYEDSSVLFDADQIQKQTKTEEEQQKQKQKKAKTVETAAFDAFDNWEPIIVSTNRPMKPLPAAVEGPDMRTAKEKLAPNKPSGKPEALRAPPTNIPPPSILLAFITKKFDSVSDEMKALVSPDPSSSGSPTSTETQRLDKLQNKLALIRASARVIAGRSLRWERDTMLSQSMKIGLAGAGNLKTKDLDKNERLKEDHETQEALQTWKRKVGSMRYTIARANAQAPGLDLMLPGVAETMSIRQGKPGEGAISAPRCCFLCGIKRDERVGKLDLFVEDSFGEWWTEYWGHVDCVIFWTECESTLIHR